MSGQEMALEPLRDVSKNHGNIATIPTHSLTLTEVRNQVNLIQQVMKGVMREDEHYGIIRGCNKPSLLKAGAEKLASTFKLAPAYEEVAVKEEDNFLSYRIRCKLIHIPTGNFVGSGIGTCNSKEKKYINHRNGPWDIQNTLYKMACKRGLVAAVLNATAASDIFTQDLEDGNIILNEAQESNPLSQPQNFSNPYQQVVQHPPQQKKNFEQPLRKSDAAFISEEQVMVLFSHARRNNIKPDQIKSYLKENYGISASKDIKKIDFNL